MFDFDNSILDFFITQGAGYLWLIAAIFFLLLELSAPGLFFFISFSIGCIIASLFAFLGFSSTTQVVIAVTASILGFLILKKLFLQKNKSRHKTNIDALVGRTAVVIKTIEPQKAGKVRVGGEKWTAASQKNIILQENTVVTIVKVKGNKLIVK